MHTHTTSMDWILLSKKGKMPPQHIGNTKNAPNSLKLRKAWVAICDRLYSTMILGDTPPCTKDSATGTRRQCYQ